MKITRRAFAAAVDRAVVAFQMSQPVHVRTLTIDFDARTFAIDGRTIHVETQAVSIPLLSTERMIVSRSDVL